MVTDNNVEKGKRLKRKRKCFWNVNLSTIGHYYFLQKRFPLIMFLLFSLCNNTSQLCEWTNDADCSSPPSACIPYLEGDTWRCYLSLPNHWIKLLDQVTLVWEEEGEGEAFRSQINHNQLTFNAISSSRSISVNSVIILESSYRIMRAVNAYTVLTSSISYLLVKRKIVLFPSL